MRIWNDPRDGRAWQIRRQPRKASAPRTYKGFQAEEEMPVDLIHFAHPPGRAPSLGGAVPQASGMRISDLDDAELEDLLDRALGKSMGHA